MSVIFQSVLSSCRVLLYQALLPYGSEQAMAARWGIRGRTGPRLTASEGVVPIEEENHGHSGRQEGKR